MPLRLHAGQTGNHALPYALPLELREGCEDMELELASGRGAVDTFAQRHERHPETLEIIEQRHQMTKIAPKTTPADNGIDPSPLRILHQRIEGWAAFLRAAHPFIDVFRVTVHPRASAYRRSSSSWFSQV